MGECRGVRPRRRLWLLIYLDWTNQQRLATLPLVVLLFPEGLLLPRSVAWTANLGLLFSTALVAGSFVWVLMLSLVRRRWRREALPISSDAPQ